MHTQLCTNVTLNFTLINGKGKKHITTIRLPLKYDPKRPQIDHNSDEPLQKHCW